MEPELSLWHCLVCNSDLSSETNHASAKPSKLLCKKSVVNGFSKKVNGGGFDAMEQESPPEEMTDSEPARIDSTRGYHDKVFCKLLNLPTAATDALLGDLKMFTEVFCRQCTQAINDVADLYAQITRLQGQIDSWRSQFESQIKRHEGCHLDTTLVDTASAVERLRGLIISGSRHSRGASPETLLCGQAESASDILEEVAIKLETEDSGEDQHDFLSKGGVRSDSSFDPANHFRVRNCSVILQRLEELPAISSSSSFDKIRPSKCAHSKSTRGTLKCTKFDAPFKAEHKVKTHMLSFHGVDQFPLSSPKCSKRFDSEVNILQHLQRQGDECKMFASQEEGSNVIGMGHQKFKCNMCQLVVATQSSLQRHMQVHSRQKPYMCDICGESFGLRFHLSRHQKWKHFDGPETEHPFKCTAKGCKKVFSCKATLKVHSLKEHRREFNYGCSKCEYKTVTIGKLNEHVSRKHSECKPSKTHSCQQCDAVFQRSDRLKLHVLKIHTNKEDVPFACEFCDKTFFERYRLKQHELSTHTNEKPETCQICGKGFALKHYLRVHMRSHRRESDRRKTKNLLKVSESPQLLPQKQKQQVSMIIVEVPPLPAAQEVIEIPSEVLELEVENPPDGSPAPAIPASVLHEVSLESMLTMQVESPYRIEFDEEFKMTNPILEN